MGKAVTHPADDIPFDIRKSITRGLCDTRGGFTDDVEAIENAMLQEFVSAKVFFRESDDELRDFSCRVCHVQQALLIRFRQHIAPRIQP